MIPRVEDAVRELHRRLSPEAAELLDLAASAPDATTQAELLVADLPAWIQAYPYPFQTWPTFVSGPKLTELRRATIAVPALVKSVPARVFGDDFSAMASFYGFDDPQIVRAILQEPNGIDSALSRSDFVDTETGLKCLEVNLSSFLGGWQIRFVVDRLLRRPWLRDLVTRHGDACTVVDPFRALLRHLVSEAARTGVAIGRELNTAFLVPNESWVNRVEPMIETLAGEYARELAGLDGGWGGRLLCAGYEDLRLEDGRTFVDDLRVHAAIEYHEPSTDPLLFRAFKAGWLNLYNGPVCFLLRDKRNLALLSENAESGPFDAAERDLIERYVPWTRSARAGETRFQGEVVTLPRFAIRNRQRLVLKPAVGSRGESILLGDETQQEVWERAIEGAFATGRWILQERLESLPYRYPMGNGEPVPQLVIWGMFAFSDVYGGGFLRMLPPSVGGVVNSARGAREGLIAEILDERGCKETLAQR